MKTCEFTHESGLRATLSFCAESHVLEVEAWSTQAMKEAGGELHWKERFNNIGDGDPVDFLMSLGSDYLLDRTMGFGVRQVDFHETVKNVRSTIEEYTADYEELSLKDRLLIEDLISDAMIRFDGNHELSSQSLIFNMHNREIPGFTDDPYHIVGKRISKRAITLSKGLLEPLQEALDQSYDAYIDEDPFELEESQSPEM